MHKLWQDEEEEDQNAKKNCNDDLRHIEWNSKNHFLQNCNVQKKKGKKQRSRYDFQPEDRIFLIKTLY